MPSNPTNPLTLADMAQQSGDQGFVKFVEAVHKSGNLVQIFKFQKNDKLSARAFGIDASVLPTISFGALNKEATDIKTGGKPRSSWANFVRHTLSVDRAELRAWKSTREGMGPWDRQVKGFVNAWNRKFTGDIINGSTDSSGNPDPYGFVGFRNMLSTAAIRSQYNIDNNCRIDAAGLQLNPANITSTTTAAFEALLDQLLFQMNNPEGDGMWLVMNNTLRAQVTQGLKTSQNFDQTQDAFGRRIQTFRNAKILSVGYDSAGLSAIPTYEKTDGSVGVSGTDKRTSVFAICPDQDCMDNWLAGDLNPVDLPDSNVWKQKLIDAMFGFLPVDNFWLGQIFNIQITN